MKRSGLLCVVVASLVAEGCGSDTHTPSSKNENIAAVDNPRAELPRPIQRIAPAAPIILDELIGFSDGARCESYPATEELLANLLVNTSNPRELALGNLVVPPRFREAFGEPRLTKETDRDGYVSYSVTVKVSGLWHGLRIAELSSNGMAQSDAGSWTYGFNEPFERVRNVLNARGFNFDAKEDQPYGPFQETIWASLFVDRGMTILSCEPYGTPPTIEESTRRAAAMGQSGAADSIR